MNKIWQELSSNKIEIISTTYTFSFPVMGRTILGCHSGYCSSLGFNPIRDINQRVWILEQLCSRFDKQDDYDISCFGDEYVFIFMVILGDKSRYAIIVLIIILGDKSRYDIIFRNHPWGLVKVWYGVIFFLLYFQFNISK